MFLVFHDARGLEIAAPNGTLRTLPVDASDLRFERMSSDWVHVWSAAAGRNWILHLNDRSLEFGELPGPQVHASLPAITANRGGGK
ncbi:MAG: hypothetical protein JO091_11410 [Acidobacteriaceae bacterium]|nr:hypothetical protein [Acidobacteriaceae bacterium]